MDKLQMIGITLWALAVGILGLFAELCVIDVFTDIISNHKRKDKHR